MAGDGESVGGALLIGFLEDVLGRWELCNEKAEDVFKRNKSIVKQLPSMKSNLEKLSNSEVLDDAESMQIDDPVVKNWVNDIQDVLLLVEELMDQINSAPTKARSKTLLMKLFPTFFNPFDKAVAAKLKDIHLKMHSIFERKATLPFKDSYYRRLIPNISLVELEEQQIHPLQENFYGRQNEQEIIIDMLLSGSGDGDGDGFGSGNGSSITYSSGSGSGFGSSSASGSGSGSGAGAGSGSAPPYLYRSHSRSRKENYKLILTSFVKNFLFNFGIGGHSRIPASLNPFHESFISFLGRGDKARGELSYDSMRESLYIFGTDGHLKSSLDSTIKSVLGIGREEYKFFLVSLAKFAKAVLEIDISVDDDKELSLDLILQLVLSHFGIDVHSLGDEKVVEELIVMPLVEQAMSVLEISGGGDDDDDDELSLDPSIELVIRIFRMIVPSLGEVLEELIGKPLAELVMSVLEIGSGGGGDDELSPLIKLVSRSFGMVADSRGELLDLIFKFLADATMSVIGGSGNGDDDGDSDRDGNDDEIPIVGSVIPIVGKCGDGKTALARHVFNNNKVQQNFAHRVWVNVSAKFDVHGIMKTIFEELTETTCYVEDKNELQAELKSVLEGKKTLVVLDDVWNFGDNSLWKALSSPFENPRTGSKLVVTTRSKKVASVMGNEQIYHLPPMSDEDCRKLFIKHVNMDSRFHPILHICAKEFVKRCKGRPLAVKSLARLLCGTQHEKYSEELVDNCELWEMNVGNIIPAVRISYHGLPSFVKRCFVYCSLFPKGCEFESRRLIWLWMAEGFLPHKTGKTAEEVGEECVSHLLSTSLFHRSSKNENSLFMYDHVHDLAVILSGKFCYMMDDTKASRKASSRTHHLSYKMDVHNFDGLRVAERLQSFLPMPLSTVAEVKPLENSVPLELLLTRRLRVLSLCHVDIKELPDSIGNLKHLRYLDLSHTKIEKISNAVCTLHELQTLLLSYCLELTELPIDMGSLIKLRHMDISGTPLREMPLNMGDLKNLQTLSDFYVGVQNGSRIKELQSLSDLHGSLNISGLENVDDGAVIEANLQEKRHLTKLSLKWGGQSDCSEAILGSLQPHANLKELLIFGYGGETLPKWVGGKSFFQMVSIHLRDLKNCCSLPPLGQLPSLKELEIRDFCGLQEIGPEFYSDDSSGEQPFRSLEILRFEEMPEWKDWSFVQGDEHGVFPQLKQLTLRSCLELEVCLPGYLPSLTVLEVQKCKQLMPLPQSDQQIDTAYPSLQRLRISGCTEQESFLKGGLPSSLKKLHISDCKKLQFLDNNGFQQLSSLKELEIYRCKKLENLPGGGFHRSLTDLRIDTCPLLKARCQRETGEDWNRIAHISRVDIDQERIV